MESTVEFSCEGSVLRGRLFAPEANHPTPGIVMAPGFSATSCFPVFEAYARSIADCGVAALLFDVRGIGLSGGEPRFEINAWAQVCDYLAAVDFLRGLDTVDSDSVGVWGVSLSAAVAAVAAATDSSIAAVVLLVPPFGDELSPPDRDFTHFNAIRDTLARCDFDSYDRTEVGPLPVVSSDQLGTPSLVRPLSAYRWFIESGARYGTHWENLATVCRLSTPVPLDAQVCVPHIDAPILMVIAEQEEMEGADADVARTVFSTASEPKQLLTSKGGHFGVLYENSPEFLSSVRTQQRFLNDHLMS